MERGFKWRKCEKPYPDGYGRVRQKRDRGRGKEELPHFKPRLPVVWIVPEILRSLGEVDGILLLLLGQCMGTAWVAAYASFPSAHNLSGGMLGTCV